MARAANREVKFWGDLNAAIRKPREVETGVFQAEIVVGTEIDLDEPLIDRGSLEEITADEADVRISNKHLYNGRVFLYTFVEETHLLFFESRNEFGKTLSSNRAYRIFTQLFSHDVLGADFPDVEVTIVPEDDTLEKLLGLYRLDRVRIFLQRPNPADVLDEEVQEVLADLEAQGAKSQDHTLVRAPDARRLVLNAANTLRAKVAQFNGRVDTSGVTEDGERVSGSTRQHPKVIRLAVDATTSLRAVALRVAKQFRIGRQRNPDAD